MVRSLAEPFGSTPLGHSVGFKEVVFSSTGDRTRAGGVPVAPVRPSVASILSTAVAGLYNALFPADCRFCQAPLDTISRLPVCADCIENLSPIVGPVCVCCGDQFPVNYQSAEGLCPECAFERPQFERVVAYGAYVGTLRDMVHLLKYEQVRPAAAVLGKLTASVIESIPLSPETVVVPVPLHAAKLKMRGFNQSELIARETLKHLNRSECLRLESAALKRRRETPSQVGMTREQRAENLKGAFSVPVASLVRDKEVLLVDDVLTTGATVAECTRVLRRAGAKRIWVATAARAVRLTEEFAMKQKEESETPKATASR